MLAYFEILHLCLYDPPTREASMWALSSEQWAVTCEQSTKKWPIIGFEKKIFQNIWIIYYENNIVGKQNIELGPITMEFKKFDDPRW
jgi:hypothetical protein